MRFTLPQLHSATGRWLGCLVLVLITLASSGCTTLRRGITDYVHYNDGVNDLVMGWRNRVWSRQAWHERKAQFAGHPQFEAFGEGFRAGYMDVATGGSGCVPALPPRKYWSWKYQTPEGQAKMAAWFSGFPHGARAAEEDQAGEYQDIQVSYLIEAQYSPEFQRGEFPPILGGHPEPHPHDGHLGPDPGLEPLPHPGVPMPGDSSFHGPPRDHAEQSAFRLPPARQPEPRPSGRRLPASAVPMDAFGSVTRDFPPRDSGWPTR